MLITKLIECKSVSYGLCTAIAGYDDSLKVCQSSLTFERCSTPFFRILRDPSQHSSLQDEIEEQSTALYSTARLWDDGIIKPTDTRDVVGLGLASVSRQRGAGSQSEKQTTWDGDGKGFGVFRM